MALNSKIHSQPYSDSSLSNSSHPHSLRTPTSNPSSFHPTSRRIRPNKIHPQTQKQTDANISDYIPIFQSFSQFNKTFNSSAHTDKTLQLVPSRPYISRVFLLPLNIQSFIHNSNICSKILAKIQTARYNDGTKTGWKHEKRNSLWDIVAPA